MTVDTPWAEPLGLSRDPHWDDAWTDPHSNEYVLPHPDNEFEQLRAGRASELGKTISNTFSLNRWHKEMVLKGVLIRKSILQRAAIAIRNGQSWKTFRELRRDEEDKDKVLKEFQTLYQVADGDEKTSRILWDLCKEAEDVAGSKEPAALGTGFHKLTELYDAGKITVDEVPEPWDRDMLAYATVLRKTGIIPVPEFTERIVWNRPINTAGRYDRLWRYLRHCDKWHVGDLKTGRDLSYGWLEILIQLLAYATATHIFDTEEKTWAPMPDVCHEVGLVLHVPSSGMVDENGEPTGGRMGALYEVDLTKMVEISSYDAGEMEFVTPLHLAVAVQRYQKVKRIAKLIYRVEVTEHGEVADVPLTLAEQIDLCDSRLDLDQLWADAKARKEWKGHHTTRAKQRLEVLAG